MDDLKSCHNFHALLSFYSNFCLLSLYIKDMSSSDNNNTNEERYKFLNQYSKDLERSRTETAPPEVDIQQTHHAARTAGTTFSTTLRIISIPAAVHISLKNLI